MKTFQAIALEATKEIYQSRGDPIFIEVIVRRAMHQGQQLSEKEKSNPMNTQPNNKTGKGNAPRNTYVVNDRLVQAKSYEDARKLRCTKAPVPYVEALAKERDQLRAKLNRMTAQRDELLAACRLAQAVIGGAETSGAAQRAAHSALFQVLSKADQP